MAESDRGSVVSSSLGTVDSGGGSSNATAVSLPVLPLQPGTDLSGNNHTSSSQLPSRKFQFSNWHDLRVMQLTGPELKAPRVRRGPAEKERAFHLLVDEDNNKLHHDLQGRQRHQHRDGLENWEKAQLASFPYQDLQHRYQRGNSDRILDRLRHAAFINLHDNALVNLSSVSFPDCEYLNLDNNFLSSLQKLPSLRKCQHLSVADNDIATFSGLSNLRKLPLEELYLIGNPISFTLGYRQKIFATLPALKFLDGVARQEEDMEAPPEEEQPQSSSCVVS